MPVVPAHPGASSPAVSARMSVFPRRDTKPELALRRLLHASGYRYRVNYPVPGRPRRTMDIGFTRFCVAVFVDGCFWHGCPSHGTLPRANRSWWEHKINVTMARDVDTTQSLLEDGWLVLRLWEHEFPDEMETRVVQVLASRSQRSSGRGSI